MANSRKDIGTVVRLLKAEIKGLRDPAVTMVGKRWKDPFLVLISCLLSLRTKDETTLPASERLFRLAGHPAQMLKLPRRRIEKAIYPVGFYRNKARTIHAVCRGILRDFGGRVPDNLETLLSLPGVGRKTANLVLIEGFGKPGICVDTHVHRISNRLGLVSTRSPDETETALRKKLPKRYWMAYNYLLVLWGQNVCKPVSPFCSRCRIRPYCERRGVSLSR